MATNFPAGLDSLVNPLGTSTLANPSHSSQHANANDAIEALQAKVGIDNSANTLSLDYKVAQLQAKYVDKTIVVAKGDVLVGTANDTVGVLNPVGTNGQVLTANSATETGLSWTTLASGVPTGSITAFAGTTAPSGWVLCDGSEYAKAGTYAALYAVVGDAFATSHNYPSAPSSASNFRVPDLRSAFAAGQGTAAWSNVRGEFGGSKDAVAVTHDHGVTQNGRSTSIIFAHATTGFSYAGNHVVGYGAETSSVAIPNDSYDFPAANHDHIVNAAGVPGTNMNLPPYVTMNYIIKT